MAEIKRNKPDQNRQFVKSSSRNKTVVRGRTQRTPDKRLFACASGRVLSLSDVDDPVFAQKMLGEGVAFVPSGDVITAPCNGTVVLISNNKNVIGLENEQGDQVLIHVGIDTSALKGKGFEPLVSEGQKVHPGQPILKFDRRILENMNVDLTTPMTITNCDPGDYRVLEADSCTGGRTLVMEKA